MAKRVLVNAVNLVGAGSQMIGTYLLPALANAMPVSSFLFLLPEQDSFRHMRFPGNVRACFTKRRYGLKNDWQRLKELFLEVPEIAREKQSTVCLSRGSGACQDAVSQHRFIASVIAPLQHKGTGWAKPLVSTKASVPCRVFCVDF